MALSFLPLLTLPITITYLFHLQTNPRKIIVYTRCDPILPFLNLFPPCSPACQPTSLRFHFRVPNSPVRPRSSSLTVSTCFHLASWTSHTHLTFLLPQHSHLFSLLLCDSSSFLQSLNFGESENSGPGHLLLGICTYRFRNITQSHKFKYYVHVDNYKTDMSHPG